MRDRKELLIDLVTFSRDLSSIEKELPTDHWDIEEAILVITESNILSVLNKYLNDVISEEELVEWANLIDFRFDLEYETDTVHNLIFLVANTDINGDVSKKKITEYISSNLS